MKGIIDAFVEQLDFPELEGTEGTADKGVHGTWRRILGLPAYAELATKYADPFLARPLNAVIRYELDQDGHTLKVHEASTDVSQELLESWEEVQPGHRFLTEAD